MKKSVSFIFLAALFILLIAACVAKKRATVNGGTGGSQPDTASVTRP